MAFARLVTHYFSHAAFLEENELLRNAGRLAGIPAVLVHGRMDFGGPPDVAWLLAQGDDIAPIPGTKRISYLEENVGAADVTLTDDELNRLDAAAPHGYTAGERYADMSNVDV